MSKVERNLADELACIFPGGLRANYPKRRCEQIARLVLPVSRLPLTAHLAVKAFQQFLNELPGEVAPVTRLQGCRRELWPGKLYSNLFHVENCPTRFEPDRNKQTTERITILSAIEIVTEIVSLFQTMVLLVYLFPLSLYIYIYIIVLGIEKLERSD